MAWLPDFTNGNGLLPFIFNQKSRSRKKCSNIGKQTCLLTESYINIPKPRQRASSSSSSREQAPRNLEPLARVTMPMVEKSVLESPLPQSNRLLPPIGLHPEDDTLTFTATHDFQRFRHSPQHAVGYRSTDERPSSPQSDHGFSKKVRCDPASAVRYCNEGPISVEEVWNKWISTEWSYFSSSLLI